MAPLSNGTCFLLPRRIVLRNPITYRQGFDAIPLFSDFLQKTKLASLDKLYCFAKLSWNKFSIFWGIFHIFFLLHQNGSYPYQPSKIEQNAPFLKHVLGPKKLRAALTIKVGGGVSFKKGPSICTHGDKHGVSMERKENDMTRSSNIPVLLIGNQTLDAYDEETPFDVQTPLTQYLYYFH